MNFSVYYIFFTLYPQTIGGIGEAQVSSGSGLSKTKSLIGKTKKETSHIRKISTTTTITSSEITRA